MVSEIGAVNEISLQVPVQVTPGHALPAVNVTVGTPLAISFRKPPELSASADPTHTTTTIPASAMTLRALSFFAILLILTAPPWVYL
jgi:hypothetical protein